MKNVAILDLRTFRLGDIMNWMVLFVAVVTIGALLHVLIDLIERVQSKHN
jgi:hypothetical protein